MRVWCFPGDTSDQTILKGVQRRSAPLAARSRDHRRRPGLLSSDDNLRLPHPRRGHYIAGEKMRDGSPRRQRGALPRRALQGRPRQPRGQRGPCSARRGPARFVVCHNPAEADQGQGPARARRCNAVEAEIERIAHRAREGQDGASTRPPTRSHVRAECALRDHPSLGRYVRQLASGRLVIDKAKIAAEERLDGKYLLSTSDPDLSAEDDRPRLQEPARGRTRAFAT